MSLSGLLLEENAAQWRYWLPHPFTRAVADGTLPAEVFRRWLAQDYRFVAEGLRFLALLLARAPHELLDALADTIHAWKTELGLFRGRAEQAGVALDVAPFFVTQAYGDFLLAVGQQESFATGWAVLFAVERSYHDAWRWAREHAALAAGAPHPYREWLENWGSDDFGAFCASLAATLDGLDAGLGEAERRRLHQRFAQTARLEALFWDMAWHGERFG